MDWKNKLKQTGIRLAKQELNKAKSKKVNKVDNSLVRNAVQQSTNRRSKGSRLVENLLETTAKDKARAAYSKPLGGLNDKLNSSTVGSIINNVVDVPGIVQDKLDSQVDRAIKSFKTPSTKSEKKKKIDELRKVENASDIGKGSKEIKQKIKDKRSSLLEDVEKRSKKNKLEESVNGLLDVFQKSTKAKQTTLTRLITDNSLKTDNVKFNPMAVAERKEFESDVKNINNVGGGLDPYLRFTVAKGDAPATEILKRISVAGKTWKETNLNERRQQTGIQNMGFTSKFSLKDNENNIIHSFNLPLQGNTLTESFSFSYETGKRSIASETMGNLNDPNWAEIAQSLLNATEKGRVLDEAAAKAGRQGNLAYNPNIEQIFQNVDIRSFSFEFLMIPRNEGEYTNLMQSIQILKYWSHPKLSDFSKFLEYPRPWKIDYVLASGADKNAKKYSETEKVLYTKEAYCTEISVQYAGGSEFLLNANDDNFSAIEIKVSFVEKEILLRDDFLYI